MQTWRTELCLVYNFDRNLKIIETKYQIKFVLKYEYKNHFK